MNYPEWILEAEELYIENNSFASIARILNVNRKLVSYYLQKKGYKPNHKFKSIKEVIQKNKKTLNEDIFEIIDTEEKAYWLGFLMADGCVNEKNNRIELCLQEKDYTHIVKFKSFLNSGHSIGKKIKDDKYVSYRLGFNSKKMKCDLINKGCVPNKTKVLKFPDIEHELIHHFIRGYLDADGCITTSKTSKVSVEILGTENMLSGIINYFNLNGHIYNFKHSDIKRFMIAGKQAMKILNSLYANSNIYLDRKFILYKNFAVLFQPSQKR